MDLAASHIQHIIFIKNFFISSGKSREVKLSQAEQKMDLLMSNTYAEGMGCSFDRGGLPPHISKYRQRLESFLNGEETNARPDEANSKPGLYTKLPHLSGVFFSPLYVTFGRAI